MSPKNAVKPLELVVSAIHCLREKKGSSPQDILKYLVGKYNVDTKTLKPHIQTGLRRGLGFGIITQQSGLYRLNILGAPFDLPAGNSKRSNPQRNAHNKGNSPIKSPKLRDYEGKRRQGRFPQKNESKVSKYKERRKKVVRNARRYKNEPKEKRQKRWKPKGKKQKRSVKRGKKVKKPETQLTNPDDENQKPENAEKREEETKPNVKM